MFFTKMLLIVLMFISTVYSVNVFSEVGRTVKIGDQEVTRERKPITCILITIITVAYIVACTFLITKVV